MDESTTPFTIRPGCKKGDDTHINWLEHQPEWCYFYPGRDCPGWGDGGTCSRVGRYIPEKEYLSFPKRMGLVHGE